VEGVDALILLQGTFCGAEPLPYIVERLHVPILLWALDEPMAGGRMRSNSLCGINLMASVLKRLDRNYSYVYGDLSDAECRTEVETFLKAAAAVRYLRTMRVGLAGSRAPGFFPLDVDEMALRHQVGPELVMIDMMEIFFGDEPPAAEVEAVKADFLQRVRNVATVPPERLDRVARTVAVLRGLFRKYELDALSVKCWPEFLNGYAAACSMISRLATDSLVAGCEGDVNGVVTSALLQHLSGGEPTFLADLVQVDRAGDTGILWHCGVAPMEMAADPGQIDFGLEFSGVGMNLEFALKPGRVTIARLGTLNGRYRMLVMGGEAVETPLLVRGTMAKIRFDVPGRQVLDTILLGGWEHHVTMVYGDYREALAQVARQLGIELVQL